MKKLNEVRGLYYFVKEAKTLRGIADIIICSPNGTFVAWELKRSQWEVYYKTKKGIKATGRTALQWHNLKKIKRSGGIGEFVYPENFEEKFAELLVS